MDMHDQRFKRLPKWAQDEFIHLTTRVERAEDEVSRLLGKRESNIEYDPGVSAARGRPTFYLPDDKDVRFQLPEGYVDVSLRLPGGMGLNAVDRAVIELCGHALGDDEFVIMPRCSNLAHIGFRK